jgi:probable HAF family extracellular repeat protein
VYDARLDPTKGSEQAVGWMYDDSAEADVPFFCDPAEGVTLLELPTGTDAGHALAINDAVPPVIVGWLHDTTAELNRAAAWESDGDFIDFFYDDETPCVAEGINDDERVVGTYKDPSDPHSFVLEYTSEWTPAYTTTSGATAVNADGKVVGWHMVSSVKHAYVWVADTTTDIHPSPYDASGANAINDAGYIGGWVEDDGVLLASLWTPLTPGVYTVDPFNTGADAEITDLNDEGEMVIMRTDATPGVAIWSKRGSVNSPAPCVQPPRTRRAARGTPATSRADPCRRGA